MNLRCLTLLLLVACDGSDATYAVATNVFAADADGAPTSVFKVFYRTTLFTEPIAPGNDTPAHLVAPGGDRAYAILAPGWSPDAPDAGPPPSFVGVVTAKGILATKGGTVRIELGPTTVRGACAGEPPLTRDEYDVLKDRIFPAENLPAYDGPCDAGAD
jgi:hypothetical protein